MSSFVNTPPVGLAGELRITSLVFSLRPPLNSSRSNLNPFSWRSGTKTGVPPHEVHHRLVDREGGVRQQYLVALVHEREDGEEHDRLPPRRDDDLPRVHLQCPGSANVGGDGGA
jgi:hypothetical protein